MTYWTEGWAIPVTYDLSVLLPHLGGIQVNFSQATKNFWWKSDLPCYHLHPLLPSFSFHPDLKSLMDLSSWSVFCVHRERKIDFEKTKKRNLQVLFFGPIVIQCCTLEDYLGHLVLGDNNHSTTSSEESSLLSHGPGPNALCSYILLFQNFVFRYLEIRIIVMGRQSSLPRQ